MNRKHKHLPQVNSGLAVCLLLLFLQFSPLPAQAAPVIVLDTPAQQNIRLDRYVDILDDSAQQLHAEQLAQPPYALQFSPVDLSHREQMAHYSEYIWLRFSISNPTHTDQQLWLKANDTSILSLQGYQRLANGKLVTLQPAPLESPLSSPILKSVSVPANSTQSFFIQLHTAQPHSFELELNQPLHYFYNSLQTSSEFSASLGVMVLMIIFCYIIALYRSSLIFLYQGHYIASIFFLELIGLGLTRNWYPNFADWQYAAIFVFFYLANASALYVTQHYLKANNCYDGFRSAIHFGLHVNFIGFLILLFWVDAYSPLIWTPIAITTPIILSATYYCYRKTRLRIALLNSWCRLISAIVYSFLVFYRFDSFGLNQVIDPVLLICLILEAFTIGMLFLVQEFELFGRERNQQQLLQINETKQQVQNQLLAEVSHDLRSPISGILGMAELLQSTPLSPSQLEQLEAIKSSGQTLLNKVAELHQRMQLQQGELASQKAPFELALLIEECVSGFQLQAEERNLELILSIQPDVPVIVEGNAIYLRQILMQLINNAVKYTAQGEVVIQVSCQASQSRTIHFSVKDTGRGISKQQLTSLQQDKHEKIDLSQPFGLPVVKALLQQLRSQLKITSTLGEGSEFSFDMLLPAARLDNQNLTDNHHILHGKSLLIVDDNHTCCKVLKQQASSWGMQVKEAFDGNEALAIFRAKKNLNEPFDAIIVDYDMPHLSGVEVAETILNESDSAPVMIMLTGLSLTPPESITRKAGIEVVLNKPASQKLIRLTLNNLFHQHQKQQSQPQELNPLQLKVLIAEDNDVSRRVISKMMERLNVDFKLASNGQLALDAIKRERFDLILMDCEMPIMDGFQATREIHQWQVSKHQTLTPVIALTAHVLGEHKVRSEEAGMVDYLEKPVQMAELEALLRKWTTHQGIAQGQA